LGAGSLGTAEDSSWPAWRKPSRKARDIDVAWGGLAWGRFLACLAKAQPESQGHWRRLVWSRLGPVLGPLGVNPAGKPGTLASPSRERLVIDTPWYVESGHCLVPNPKVKVVPFALALPSWGLVRLEQPRPVLGPLGVSTAGKPVGIGVAWVVSLGD
jgi:hypothetical protein